MKRAEKFNRALAKLDAGEEGNTFMDKFRELVTQADSKDNKEKRALLDWECHELCEVDDIGVGGHQLAGQGIHIRGRGSEGGDRAGEREDGHA